MKNRTLLFRTGIIVVITLIALYLVFGPRQTPSASDFSWSGIKNNLAQNINLGLDLRGGSHLVMRVKTEDYLKTLTENTGLGAQTIAQQASLPVGEPKFVTGNNTYQITLPVTDPNQKQAVLDAIKQKIDMSQWTQSETADAIVWTLPLAAQRALSDQAVEQALRIIDGRINSFGVKEPTLARQGGQDSHQILLQMPGVDDPERVKKLIGETAQLSLMKVVSPPSPSPIQTYPTREAALQSIGGQETATRKVYPYMDRDDTTTDPNQPNNQQPSSYVVVEAPAVVDGNELREATAYSQTGADSDYKIAFALKPAGAQKFGDWTAKNINNYMAVVLNEQVKSAPYIKSQISDQGEITGRFTKESAEDLALTLKSGALPAGIEYQEERTVGPSLGADSIRAGVSASLAGLIFIVIFMLIYYRGSGVNAVVALILNMILTLAALIMFDSTLTLPGIAGLILGIGMAVDSNVLIFERIREELRAGKAVQQAVDLGFDRAFITIIDTHITTIISSIILYMYGSGPIRGFAVTLILGLLINLFSAVFVSRTIFMWLLDKKRDMKKLSI